MADWWLEGYRVRSKGKNSELFLYPTQKVRNLVVL